MAAFTNEMRIDSSSTTVFDLMADARTELAWKSGVSRVELLSDEPVGDGSQSIVEDRRRVAEAETSTHANDASACRTPQALRRSAPMVIRQ